MIFCLSIHYLIDIWVASFWLLYIMLLWMNIQVQVFMWTYVFISFVYMHRNVTAESHGKSMLNISKKCRPVSKATDHFTSLPALYKGSNFSHPHQHLLLSGYFDDSNPSGYEVIPHCRLICISLIVNDIGNLFMQLLTIHISSLKKCQLKSFPHFPVQLFVCELSFYGVFWSITFLNADEANLINFSCLFFQWSRNHCL